MEERTVVGTEKVRIDMKRRVKIRNEEEEEEGF